MARYVDYVVHATHDPEVAVLVATRAVAGEVRAVDLREVVRLVAIGVAVDRSEHPGPWAAHDQQAALVGPDTFAVARDDVGRNPWERKRRGAGLGGGYAGHWADHDSTGLGLPPGIDDRTSLAADHFAIPHPGLGIDRLTDRTEQAQTRQVMLFHPRVAPLDERANRGGRRVEDADLVLLDHLPEAIVLGKIRRAFVHDDSRARSQRPVHGVAVA